MGEVTASKLAEALAKAQSEFSGAKADSLNPHFKSKYADLASVWEAIREPLTRNGLSVVQFLDYSGDKVLLVTELLHSSGEIKSGRYPILLPAEKLTNPQMLGAAVTYARRYSLSAIVGIAQDDDDGNSISNSAKAKVMKPETKYSEPPFDIKKPFDPPKIATYEIKFGKFQGKKFEQLDIDDLKSYCDYIVATAKKDNKPIKGNVKEFLDLADEYLSGVDQFINSKEELPF